MQTAHERVRFWNGTRDLSAPAATPIRLTSSVGGQEPRLRKCDQANAAIANQHSCKYGRIRPGDVGTERTAASDHRGARRAWNRPDHPHAASGWGEPDEKKRSVAESGSDDAVSVRHVVMAARTDTGLGSSRIPFSGPARRSRMAIGSRLEPAQAERRGAAREGALAACRLHGRTVEPHL